ncbi:DNA ligase D [Sphingomonas sp. MM-1]|nr:DNA ligase D [Sphingomonas sp. MM-1]
MARAKSAVSRAAGKPRPKPKVRAAAAKGEAALDRYRAMRDFSRTAEPSGATRPASGHGFVVQKHDATRLHYDFRLEMDGVLKSWAVTRGPSPDPADKRLAVRTEDHPLDYAHFEGTIPKGQYGGGTVMLWDEGTWEPMPGKDPRRTLEEGHLHFILHGRRMKGEWLLVRLKPRAGEKRENWLLRKVDDDFAGGPDDLVGQYLTSVESGRSMAEIADGAAPPKRATAKAAAGTGKAKPATMRGRADSPPPFRPVQLATLVDHAPAGDRWLHELKYDGYRLLLAVGGGKARAYTRSGLDWSDRFPAVVAEAAGLAVRSALIDGEAVVLDAEGRSSFQALQAALKGDPAAIIFFAFDLLTRDGEDLTALPLLERKQRLAALIGAGGDHLHYADHVAGRGEAFFQKACKAGLEGIVSKRADAAYAGGRSGSWVKVKCLHRQEFVLLGWTSSDRNSGFRSLLLGLNEEGGLRYAGKVGTGFDMAEIDRLLAAMKPLETATAPVSAPRAATRGAHWIEPRLVVEVAFTEFTGDGVLRHPSYIGLREDKPAEAVIREEEVPVAELAERSPSPVRITNRDRVIFPDAGITKGALADYYEAIAPAMLPWVANRPISLVRCPQGRARKCFFQKHDAGSFGDHVHHIPIREKDGGEEPYLYIEDAAGLLACVQMGTIEFHGWGAPIADIERPDRLVFDLDPDEGLEFGEVTAAAAHIRDELAAIGLATFAMVTGGKGVHVVAPLRPEAEWPEVKDFARRFATALAETQPQRFTSALAKARRKGRIFVDYLRNERGATAVMPYSARAREGAPVAAPLTWEELRALDRPAPWHVGDVDDLVRRAASRDLAGWGRADQALPGV